MYIPTTPIDPATGHVEFVHVNLQDRTDEHIRQRNNYLRHFISTVVEEYNEASRSDSVSSYHYRLLLLPHLESLLKVCTHMRKGLGIFLENRKKTGSHPGFNMCMMLYQRLIKQGKAIQQHHLRWFTFSPFQRKK